MCVGDDLARHHKLGRGRALHFPLVVGGNLHHHSESHCQIVARQHWIEIGLFLLEQWIH